MRSIDETDRPRLDPAAIARLREVGGEPLLHEMVTLFEPVARERLLAVQRAVESRDADAVARAAHALRGTASNIGARVVERMAGDLEDLAGVDPAPSAWEALAVRLEHETIDVIRHLQHEINGPDGCFCHSEESRHARPRNGNAEHRSNGAAPEVAAPVTQRNAIAEEGAGEPSAAPAARPRIAIVEDNPDNLLLARLLLEAHYDIDEYVDGIAAIEGLQADRPDIVLLDISLPGMDGPEVLDRLRSIPDLAGLPVVALTAHAMAGDRERFLAMGFDEYLSKPILDEEALLCIVRSLV